MKAILDALTQIQGNQGVKLEVEEGVMVMVEGMEEHMMVILKGIAEVEVVSEAEVGEEVIGQGDYNQAQKQKQGNNQIQGNQNQAQLKIKQMMVIMQSSPLVIITKDREKVHSVFM